MPAPFAFRLLCSGPSRRNNSSVASSRSLGSHSDKAPVWVAFTERSGKARENPVAAWPNPPNLSQAATLESITISVTWHAG
ncbi:hypothetical protein Mesop_1429 [Mesorhizobium opportunistum WSM2075]|uniref:Uncharacterized protein n=1 Tax=Mesorhizobium opportunistum (strain LMG 24607 / HAMBI 3007 / WSM2075) TaxID=536019 RepID=F7XZI5_MESOW|nr:hypothetical protein Mesop_1429 [Mesorhizobium opportunistum WSM2075]